MRIHLTVPASVVIKQLEEFSAVLQKEIDGCDEDLAKLGKSIIEDPYADAKKSMLEGSKLSLEANLQANKNQIELVKAHQTLMGIEDNLISIELDRE